MTGRETGTVKWFSSTKGYGFIERDLGGDVLVHHCAIRGQGYRSLAEGQRVEFMVVQGEKDPCATGVVVLLYLPRLDPKKTAHFCLGR